MDLGQCTEAMNNLLGVEETYEDIDGESEVIRLLLLINSIAYYYKSKSYPVLVIHVALRKFYLSYQSSSSSCDEYFETMTQCISQAQSTVPPKKGENILRGPGTMHGGNE